jgi:uncharacterized protein YyaL (SSP411 family)
MCKSINDIEISINRFLNWLDNYGFESYDQFDFWATKFGVWAKKKFLKNKIIASPFVISIQLLESFFPKARVLFARKQRFAIGDAHYALAYINLYKYYNKKNYLEKAKKLLDALMTYSTKTKNGRGWGYPYTWVTQYCVFEKNTPVITVTPYCFNAFLEMYNFTKDKRYYDILDKITKFAAYDLNETKISNSIIASSYGPNDTSEVINAVAYRAALLLKAYKLFNKEEYLIKAKKNINFVLESQNDNGSWLYASDSRFVDNFHTCFVLNKLTEAYKILNDNKILESIKQGYKFYRENFQRKDGTLIHFYKLRFPKFRKIEMYDYAEGISLGCLLKDHIDGAFEYSNFLADALISKFQLRQGYFVTRVSSLGTRNKIPYLRWPQAQILYSLTNVLIGDTSKEI